jgi:capsular polysaccharide biosynthesis protein
MGKNKSKYDFNSSGILFFFFKKIKPLIIVGILAVIISGIAAFMIKPKFKSTVIVFPTSDASISKSILNTQYYTSKGGDIMNFGSEQEADQLLQVLNSKDMKDLINNKYNLMKHYGLDSLKTKYAITKYYDWFDANFSFRRTEYVSIVIEVLDTDPILAAAMANSAAAFADTIIDRMLKSRARKSFEIAKREYFQLDSIILAQEDSVNKLRMLGALNYEDQSLYLWKQYYKALLKGRTDIANAIDNKLKTIRKYAKNIGILQNTITYERLQVGSLYYKYTEAKVELEQKLPHKYIIESARVSEKKAYPKRMIIILASSISAIFFAFVLMLILDSIKKYI